LHHSDWDVKEEASALYASEVTPTVTSSHPIRTPAVLILKFDFAIGYMIKEMQAKAKRILNRIAKANLGERDCGDRRLWSSKSGWSGMVEADI
jgi:hypothetical protein